MVATAAVAATSLTADQAATGVALAGIGKAITEASNPSNPFHNPEVAHTESLNVQQLTQSETPVDNKEVNEFTKQLNSSGDSNPGAGQKDAFGAACETRRQFKDEDEDDRELLKAFEDLLEQEVKPLKNLLEDQFSEKNLKEISNVVEGFAKQMEGMNDLKAAEIDEKLQSQLMSKVFEPLAKKFTEANELSKEEKEKLQAGLKDLNKTEEDANNLVDEVHNSTMRVLKELVKTLKKKLDDKLAVTEGWSSTLSSLDSVKDKIEVYNSLLEGLKAFSEFLDELSKEHQNMPEHVQKPSALQTYGRFMLKFGVAAFFTVFESMVSLIQKVSDLIAAVFQSVLNTDLVPSVLATSQDMEGDILALVGKITTSQRFQKVQETLANFFEQGQKTFADESSEDERREAIEKLLQSLRDDLPKEDTEQKNLDEEFKKFASKNSPKHVEEAIEKVVTDKEVLAALEALKTMFKPILTVLKMGLQMANGVQKVTQKIFNVANKAKSAASTFLNKAQSLVFGNNAPTQD